MKTTIGKVSRRPAREFARENGRAARSADRSRDRSVIRGMWAARRIMTHRSVPGTSLRRVVTHQRVPSGRASAVPARGPPAGARRSRARRAAARGLSATRGAWGADPLGPNSVRGGVWTPYGGWFPDPKQWRRHTLGGFVALGALSFATWNFSRAREQRPIYPAHPIPSQRWSNAFDENGPRAT